MSSVVQNVRILAAKLAGKARKGISIPISMQVATALDWTEGRARTELLKQPGLSIEIARAYVDEQPAAVFAAGNQVSGRDILSQAALFAYHSSIEWGVVSNRAEAIIFNSHWIKNGYWFHLPPIRWEDIGDQLSIFEALTPSGLTKGSIEEIASTFYKPDSQLVPVDDALVDRLDHWRDETMRHAKYSTKIDEKLQTLFAQFFVLRAVEDRKLAIGIPRLSTAVNSTNEADLSILNSIMAKASSQIQSELFDQIDFDIFPPFVLAGIIRDLYTPSHLPISDAEYNFSWIDADVLGRAYEKYLSTLLVPAAVTRHQLSFWEQPLREVERVTVRKASGVYYTPSFLVKYLTEQCLDRYFANTKDPIQHLPRIADISCGSGSFLAAAVDGVIRRCKKVDPSRNWGRELVNRKCITGIDNDDRAVTFARLSLWLRLAEEPKPLPLPRLEGRVVSGDSLKEETWAQLPKDFDMILGNPPFMAAGNVQSRGALALRFKTAQGRFDYSYLFIEQALNKLKPSGILGLVVPNRLFRNRDAGILRELLTEQANLVTVIDFGSNEVFSGTSSYTGTIIAQRNHVESSPDVRFIRVLELPTRFAGALLAQADQDRIEVRGRYVVGYDTRPPQGPQAWIFLSQSARKAKIRLESRSEPLSSIAGIFQGIRTGANDIFLVDIESYGQGALVHIRNGLGDVHIIEKALLRSVVFGSDIQRYDLVRSNHFLIYPYHSGRVVPEDVLQREFPQAFRYLSGYRNLLSDRSTVTSRGKSWYELAWQRDPSWLEAQKLLIRDLATETSFAWDDLGATYLVGGTSVVPADSEILPSLMAYLNSKLADWYVNQLTSSFRAGFHKFEPQHLQNLPILVDVIDDTEIRDRLTELAGYIISSKQAGDAAGQNEHEIEVNYMLCDLLGIDQSELE